ncbi:ABC transporter, CydDC cysteine exporter (CydDC- E) family, permease/ATP-binding protein CydC [Segniliparus rotundus DSM 44985]|uniref:ABC transporter, CydDC cysteine exporter (CydDC-E) family, permease/ATP-binding protein CydC n=1 Tax=Segniliparus rotundus (strain ATCC BAA-972 / CDC 1076 / CIP 108378 / DSM 44985 / JCM 13578) TaxID=640132 RepID=D6ZFJ3_SEGRD|nr:thiol reductant ABC exporter subunit CydC [Segniliparus rotundus]ADG97717.1 ABC transporter, CydDC cysteine exporter (CydDC- E) family, permease/ATP-binding protein CydC [Segniliparus rotundus DSM 44985]
MAEFWGVRRGVALLSLRPARVALALCAGAATHLCALALTALSGWLILRAWQMPPVLSLSIAIVAVRALGLSRGLFRYLDRLAAHRVALGGLVGARERVYSALAAGNPSATCGMRRGELAERLMADLDAVGDVVVRALLPFGVALVTAASAVIAMVFFAPGAAVVLAMAAVLVIGAVPLLAVRAARADEEAGVLAQTTYVAEAATVLEHCDELQVAGALPKALAVIGDSQSSVVAARDRAAKPHAWAAAALPFGTGLAVLAVFSDTGLAQSASAHPAALAVAVFLALAAFDAASALPEAAGRLVVANAAAVRVLGLLDRAGTRAGSRSDRGRPPAAVAPAHIRAEELAVGWSASSAQRLGSIDIAPGSRLAVLGPSGSGKTTFLLTLAGLVRPQGGEVRGLAPDPAALRAQVAYFPEDGHLFATTVRENLLVANGAAAADEIEAALAAVDMLSWARGLPQGMDTVLTGGAQAVSAGQRRRLLLARALVSQAPVLLLDEPTEHLDAQSSAVLLRRLLTPEGSLVPAGRTVVLATHHREAVSGCRALEMPAKGANR